jgi:hypothetical protein
LTFFGASIYCKFFIYIFKKLFFSKKRECVREKGKVRFASEKKKKKASYFKGTKNKPSQSDAIVKNGAYWIITSITAYLK